MNRRSYLLTGLGACLGGLSGCVDNGDGSDEGETPTETAEDTPTETAEDTPTETAEDTPTETEEPEESVRYGDLYNYDSDYAVDLDFTDPDSDKSGMAVARYHGDDHYLRVMPDDSDDVYELYLVDGTTYAVINDEECYIDPPLGSGSGAEAASEAESNSDAESHGSRPDADLNPAGTTQIDGETVYVFEVTGEDIEGTMTLYVSAETGYLRRVEAIWGMADFYSWGDTAPISEPDMDCQDVSDY